MTTNQLAEAQALAREWKEKAKEMESEKEQYVSGTFEEFKKRQLLP